jgi:hypothetical protein
LDVANPFNFGLFSRGENMIKKIKLSIYLCIVLVCVGCKSNSNADKTISSISEDYEEDIKYENVTETECFSTQGTIMSGDFSCLENEDWESMQESYKRENDKYEWRLIDLNGDGIEDLILQEKDTVDEYSNRHRILGIFACEEDGAKCVLWDDAYMGEFSFCGPTGELMLYYYNFGGMVDTEGYQHYYYDMEWNKVIDYRLVIWGVNSPEGYDYPTEWFESHPDMQEEGIYYRKYEGAYAGDDAEGEVLTLEGLKEIYETEMGMEMYSTLTLGRK